MELLTQIVLTIAGMGLYVYGFRPIARERPDLSALAVTLGWALGGILSLLFHTAWFFVGGILLCGIFHTGYRVISWVIHES